MKITSLLTALALTTDIAFAQTSDFRDGLPGWGISSGAGQTRGLNLVTLMLDRHSRLGVRTVQPSWLPNNQLKNSIVHDLLYRGAEQPVRMLEGPGLTLDAGPKADIKGEIHPDNALFPAVALSLKGGL